MVVHVLPRSRLDEFLERPKFTSRATVGVYKSCIRRTLGPDIEGFLRLTQEEMEDALIRHVSERARNGTSPSAIRTDISAAKSFLDWCRVDVDWNRVHDELPRMRRVMDQRLPTIQEVQKVLQVADPREKAMILLLASSGMRIGALARLKVGDVQARRVSNARIGEVRAYNTKRQRWYTTYCSDEALEAINRYIDLRKQAGEQVTEDSPLIARSFDFRKGQVTGEREMNHGALPKAMGRVWQKAGLRKKMTGAKAVYEWKSSHVWRKNFNTIVQNAGMPRNMAMTLLDDLTGLDASYYQPSHLAEGYAKVMPSLYLQPEWRQRTQMNRMEGVIDRQESTLRIILERMKFNKLNPLPPDAEIVDADTPQRDDP
jgi:integrase